MKALLPLEAGFFFQYRDADLFSGTGVDGGFVDDDGAFFHVAADTGAGADQRAEVGLVRFIYGSGHRYNDVVGLAEQCGVGRNGELGGRF